MRTKLIDLSSLATLIATVVLFVVALFSKGLTHDLLLEAGVFLVSVKLVIAAYKQQVAYDAIVGRLDLLLAARGAPGGEPPR